MELRCVDRVNLIKPFGNGNRNLPIQKAVNSAERPDDHSFRNG